MTRILGVGRSSLVYIDARVAHWGVHVFVDGYAGLSTWILLIEFAFE